MLRGYIAYLSSSRHAIWYPNSVDCGIDDYYPVVPVVDAKKSCCSMVNSRDRGQSLNCPELVPLLLLYLFYARGL